MLLRFKLPLSFLKKMKYNHARRLITVFISLSRLIVSLWGRGGRQLPVQSVPM